jgi:hypothetical protein
MQVHFYQRSFVFNPLHICYCVFENSINHLFNYTITANWYRSIVLCIKKKGTAAFLVDVQYKKIIGIYYNVSSVVEFFLA